MLKIYLLIIFSIVFILSILYKKAIHCDRCNTRLFLRVLDKEEVYTFDYVEKRMKTVDIFYCPKCGGLIK